MDALVIDGSALEGGGQVLRVAFALAALMRKRVVVERIRGGRDKPGLKAQHLQGILLTAQLSGGRVEGAELHSTRVEYWPPRENEAMNSTNKFTADTKTAGAVTLLAQIALPVALFRGSKTILELKGGTNTHMAPQIEHYEQVFLPTLRRLFASSLPTVNVEVLRRGFFPKGGGQVRLVVDSSDHLNKSLSAFNLVDAPKEVKNVEVFTVGPNANFARGQAKSVEGLLRRHPRIKTSTNVTYRPSVASGSSLVLVANMNNDCLLSGDALGSRKDEPLETARAASDMLLHNVDCGGCVDEFMQDQLIIFMALAEGSSRLMCGQKELSLHTRTAIHVCQLLTHARFQVEQIDGNQVVLCQGIGLKVGLRPSTDT